MKGLLPIEAENRGRGRRADHNRSIINGILWRLRCGTPWRDVPPKYGNWNTIYRRFRRWNEAGVREAAALTLAAAMADMLGDDPVTAADDDARRARQQNGAHDLRSNSCSKASSPTVSALIRIWGRYWRHRIDNHE